MNVGFDVESGACEWLIRHARSAEVLKPALMRDGVVDFARETLSPGMTGG